MEKERVFKYYDSIKKKVQWKAKRKGKIFVDNFEESMQEIKCDCDNLIGTIPLEQVYHVLNIF